MIPMDNPTHEMAEIRNTTTLTVENLQTPMRDRID